MRHAPSSQPEQIQQLLIAGRSIADGFLRNTGQVPPMMLAFFEGGMVIHSAASTTHPEMKDDFAGACRLLARANRSTAIVLIFEAWARMTKLTEPIDTSIRPSTAPDRIEIISLSAEIPGHSYMAMHEIQRDESGKFLDLGDDRGTGSGSVKGRFAGILPDHPPTDLEVDLARQVLVSFGINPDGTRINAQWN
jgi:hypothetical protein